MGRGLKRGKCPVQDSAWHFTPGPDGRGHLTGERKEAGAARRDPLPDQQSTAATQGLLHMNMYLLPGGSSFPSH